MESTTLDQLTALSVQMDQEEMDCELPAIIDFVVNAPVGIVLVKEDGTILWCNKRFATLLASKKEDLIDTNVRDRYISDVEIVFDKFDQREEIQKFPITLRRDDGKVVDCLLYSAVREIDGQWENTRCALIGGEVRSL